MAKKSKNKPEVVIFGSVRKVCSGLEEARDEGPRLLNHPEKRLPAEIATSHYLALADELLGLKDRRNMPRRAG